MVPENDDAEIPALDPEAQDGELQAGRDASGGELPATEHTKDSPNDQEKDDDFLTDKILRKERKQAADPRGVPWVDFYPEFTHKKPKTLAGRLVEHRDTLSQILKNKELFKLRTLDIYIHRSYYKMWVNDSNRIFRNATRLRIRLAKLKAARAAKDEDKNKDKA